MLKKQVYGLALSLAILRLTQIVKQRHAGKVEYYPIINTIEIQQLLHDIVKVILYRYLTDINFELDVDSNLWYPVNMKKNIRNNRNMTLEDSKEENNINDCND